MTETWLTSDSTSDSILIPQGYSVTSRSDRKSGPGGGVAILTSVSLVCTVQDIPLPDYDFCCACIYTIDSLAIMMICVYLPPIGSRYLVDVNDFQACLTQCHGVFHDYVRASAVLRFNVYVLGDFNFPHTLWPSIKSTNAREENFLDAIMDFNLTPLVFIPTHRAGNVLDNILTNNPDSNLVFSRTLSINHKLSDHHALHMDIDANISFNRAPFTS
jgi:hypothetical protein